MVELSSAELRAVADYAATCARPALLIFERERPGDQRPRAAVNMAQAFANGAMRTKTIRDAAWAAMRAFHEARDAGQAAAGEAARAAMSAASAVFLHPLPKATQVRHVLGAAAHAARAVELSAMREPAAGTDYIAWASHLATPAVIAVLSRYPPVPAGSGRVGELMRELDVTLRKWTTV